MRNTNLRLMQALSLFLLFAWALSCRQRDPEVAESVRSKVSALSQGISVDVKDGIVTLSGEVSDSAMRSSIEGTAKGVLGVRSVVNSLRVKQPVIQPAKEELR